MHELVTAVDIDAPAETVWTVLTDFGAYPEWNDYTRIEGEATVGTTLRVSPGPEAGKMPSFSPEVLVAERSRELRWLGHLLVPGLFDGEHRFVIDPQEDGGVRLTQSETFRGVLAGLVLRFYGDATEQNFRAVNAALRDRAEAVAAGDGTDSAVVDGEEVSA